MQYWGIFRIIVENDRKAFDIVYEGMKVTFEAIKLSEWMVRRVFGKIILNKIFNILLIFKFRCRNTCIS